jgi:hypothetical protein
LIVGEKKMIKILSDSTCDLSKELVQRYNIGIIPLYVRLGDEEYLDPSDAGGRDCGGDEQAAMQISNARRHKKGSDKRFLFSSERGT